MFKAKAIFLYLIFCILGLFALNAQGLKLTGWPYQVDVVKDNLKIFKEQTGIGAVFEPYPSDNYRDKMIASFVGGTKFDVVYVRDNFLAEWASAGWIIPVDTMPGIKDLKKDLSKATVEQLSFNGKIYGLPYYSGMWVMTYNKEHLRKIGITAAPETWDDLLKVAKALKDNKISDNPIILQLKRGPNYYFQSIETIAAGFGGSLFDKNMVPTFNKPDSSFSQAVSWIRKGIEAGLINRASLSTDDHDAVNTISSGASTFTITADYNLKTMNDSKKSKVAGNILAALVPGNKKTKSGTTAYVRFYAITKASKNKKSAWELVKFLGGKDKTGQYRVAKRWALDYGLGFSQLSLYEDKDIRKSLSQWTDPKILATQSEYIVNRPYRFVPHFSDWLNEFSGDLQGLITEKNPKKRQNSMNEMTSSWEDM